MYSYRVIFHPTSTSGVPVPNPGGREWHVDIDAPSRAAAEKAAPARIGYPHVLVDTQRLDDVVVAPVKRAPRKRAKPLSKLGLVTAAALLAQQESAS